MAAVSAEQKRSSVHENDKHGNGHEESDDEYDKDKRGRSSKKHKHKHSKSKKKHKKRRHRSNSRSRSKSQSRSRSRSKSVEKLTEKKENADKAKSEGSFDEAAVHGPAEPKEGTATVRASDERKSRSKSPLNPIKKSKSKSPSNSDDEKPTLRSRSRSRSFSWPPRERKSRSKSKSPKPKSEVPEKKSRSLSKSKSRSRSPAKDPSNNKGMSRSRSPTKSKTKKSRSRSRSKSPAKSRSRKSPSRSRSGRKKSRSRSRSRSKSPGRGRRKRSPSPRSKSRSKSPKRKSDKSRRSRSPRRSRRSKSPRSSRRSKSPRPSRKSRSRSPRSSKRQRSPPRRSRSRSRSRNKRFNVRGRSRSPRRQRRRSRSRSQSPRKRCSRSRSAQRRNRSRSTSPRHKRRSHSRSPRRRRSSRSRSPRKRRSRSRSHVRSKRSKRSRSKSAEKSKDEDLSKYMLDSTDKPIAGQQSIAKPSVAEIVGSAPKVGGGGTRSIAELTEFCKRLTEARGIETNTRPTESKATSDANDGDESPVISHPFLVRDKPDIFIPTVIFPVPKPLQSGDPNKPLTEQFPVSCGSKHREKEDVITAVDTPETVEDKIDGSVQNNNRVFQQPAAPEVKLDISDLVVKRMEAQRRLTDNPHDLDAMLIEQEVSLKMQNWAQSNVKPGQFTGHMAKAMMPKQGMHTGAQAWAKKDMFHHLAPLRGGVGMRLLQKMGWEPGRGIGKSMDGNLEPIALTVKTDRKGLSSGGEHHGGKKAGKQAGMGNSLQGKHPISMLQEICARKKWGHPDFQLIFDHGPPHNKQFLFKVIVNGYQYQPQIASANKKHAKANCALYALKALGAMPHDAQV